MLINPFDRFTKEAKQALQIAEEEAKKVKLNYIGTEHLLLGILSIPKALGCSILLGIGVSYENVQIVLQTAGQKGDFGLADSKISTYLAKIIEDALKIAIQYQHTFVGTEHLLHAITLNHKCAAAIVLENMQVNLADLKGRIEKILSQISAVDGTPLSTNKSLEDLLNGITGVLVGAMQNSDHLNKKKGGLPLDNIMNAKKNNNEIEDSATPALDFFGTNLTEEYIKKKLDPVIGRNKEIDRIINILNRKTKNNPVLIGEPGVGKTAIVEGLAQRIVQNKVPNSLLGKKLITLDLGEMIAGTKFRGEFEERLKDVINEAITEENRVILFIDELHTLVGAGSAEGSLDAANILKPALSRGKIQLIGATTLDEYKKYIEKDKALERRFQQLIVDEPSEEDAIKILAGLRLVFENYHSLYISDAAIKASVTMSKRYIFDRFLPDKAIDLIDEACARKGGYSIEEGSKIKVLQVEILKIEKNKAEAVARQEYKKAIKLKEKQQEIQNQLHELINPAKKVKRDIVVNVSDIAEVVSSMTGIQVKELVRDELSRLKNINEKMQNIIIGQEEAINEVTKAIIRNRVGLIESQQPIASFIFMGPSGVGKTELVKQLAKIVYEDKDALIKIDMSEFMEKHNVSRLLGSSAGYVGYEEGGQLTEAVRRKPYAVILFDEIEKAHPEVLNILLQVMEDGYLTDAKGKKINFKNTIIVMTSNIGGDILAKEAELIGFSYSEGEKLKEAEADFIEKAETVKNQLNEFFPVEFLNRLDKVIVFKPLSQKQIKKILTMQLKEFLAQITKNKHIEITVSEVVINALAKKAYNPEFGARNVRKILLEDVEYPIVEGMVNGLVKYGDIYKLVRTKNDDKKFEVIKNTK